MKYFKLDKDKREIIIDKYKKYNVNIDILDLIIDLKCENDRLNNIINELEKWLDIHKNTYLLYGTKEQNQEYEVICYKSISNKLKELKDSDK